MNTLKIFLNVFPKCSFPEVKQFNLHTHLFASNASKKRVLKEKKKRENAVIHLLSRLIFR